MPLRAAWIGTISQSDWLESRMFLIPAVADSSAADSIKSASCFLTRTGCNVKAENPSLDLHHIYKWNYVLQKKILPLLFFYCFSTHVKMYTSTALSNLGGSC